MVSALKYLLMYSRTVGLDPFVLNKTSLLLSIGSLCTCLVLFGPYYFEIFYYFDGLESIKRMELIAAPVEAIGLFIFFLLNKNTLKDLIITTKLFWSADKFGGKTETKIRKIRHNLLKFFVIGLLSYVISCSLLFLEIFVNNEKKYFFLGYKECESKICVNLQLAFQIFYTFFVIIPVTNLFPAYFCFFVTEIYCAVELIACGYNNLSKTLEILKIDIKELVEQHILVLRFIAAINRLYKNILVLLFAMYTFFQIFSLSLIFLDGMPPSLPVLVKYSMFLILSLVKTSMFCFGGTVLQSKYDSLRHAVYEISWWDVEEERIRFGKDIAYILQVTQRDVYLTIGSMIPLNLNTWLQTIKLIYSVSTLATSLQGDDVLKKP